MVGDILKEKGLITEEQLASAIQARDDAGADERIEQTLVRLGYVTEEDALKALADYMGVPYVDISEVEIDPALMNGIPSKFIFKNEIIPIERRNGALIVATADPLDLQPLDELRLLLSCDIEPVVSSETEISKAIKKFFGVGADTVDTMVAESGDEIQVLDEGSYDESGSDLEMAEEASLIKLVNQILLEAVQNRASDVHIEPFEDTLRVRYRVDGVLHDAGVPAKIKMFQAAIVSRLKIMAHLNVAEKRIPQDGAIVLKIGGREIDVRVSIIPMIHGEGVVLRLLDRSSSLLALEDLGMPADYRSVFESLISNPHGIVLVTGPTGSGKTTTLYAALNQINTLDRKIITIEDPVEYKLEGIGQIQTNDKIDLTFARGLRSILRHDPDVVMIGEIRDLETGEIAIQASLTGHLVFSTLHTNDAPSAITRLIDMGIEPYLVASTVEGMMAQRLVRTICENCKEERSVDDKILASLAEGEEIGAHYHGVGCEECMNTGYKGRQGIFEIMTMTEPIRELVMARSSASAIKQAARQQGMRTLREDGLIKVRDGITTIEEVYRVAKEDEAYDAVIQ